MNRHHSQYSRNYKPEDLSEARSIYYLYLGGFFSFYISTFIGYMKALKERKNKDNSIIMTSHYRYQVKIMHMNMIINGISFLGTLTYVFYIISKIDFMNLTLDDGLASSFTVAIAVG